MCNFLSLLMYVRKRTTPSSQSSKDAQFFCTKPILELIDGFAPNDALVNRVCAFGGLTRSRMRFPRSFSTDPAKTLFFIMFSTTTLQHRSKSFFEFRKLTSVSSNRDKCLKKSLGGHLRNSTFVFTASANASEKTCSKISANVFR